MLRAAPTRLPEGASSCKPGRYISNAAKPQSFDIVLGAAEAPYRTYLRWHRLSLDQSSMGREPYRIIVVEDHASTAEALRKFLTTIGYKVYIAPDIASARGLAKAIEFDVLLSDLCLPDGTGWDLMEELSATKPIRAIAISGHNTDVDIERSRKVGFLDHIAKPLVAEQLTAAIERAVTKSRPAGVRH